MGKRPAETESFEGNMSVMQWTRRPSMQRGEPPVMETGLERIAAKARCEPKVRFTSLAHHVTRDRIWGNLCGMPSKTAPGVDGQTVEEAQEEFETWVEPMLRSMHRRGYPAPAVRRVYIPKPGKRETRPIGVPCVADRALQRSVAHVLSAIYEEDFLPCSFGGRPGQGAHHALATLTEVIAGRKVSWVLEADLKNFFGSLNHDWLLRFVEHRVGDPRLLSLMRRWLKAGALEAGVHQPSEEGTPQGGSISVLLSNVYLHYVLDLWFERVVKPRLQGEGAFSGWTAGAPLCYQGELKGADLFEGKFPFSQAEPIAPRGVGGEAPNSGSIRVSQRYFQAFWGFSWVISWERPCGSSWKTRSVFQGAVGAFCASTAPSASPGPVRGRQDGSQGGEPGVMSNWTAASSDWRSGRCSHQNRQPVQAERSIYPGKTEISGTYALWETRI